MVDDVEWAVEFEYPGAKTFVVLMKSLGSLVDEALFTFSEEGLRIKALDPARVALLDIDLGTDAFLTYEVRKPISVGVNVAGLIKAIPTPKKTDKLVFKASEEFYELVIESNVTRRYRFRSIEVIAEELPEPELEFEAEAKAIASAFKTAIKDLKDAETIEFRAQGDDLVLRGVQIGAEARLSRIAGSLLELKAPESGTSERYDEGYITKVIDLAGHVQTIEVRFGSGIPLNILFPLAEGGFVKYLLAPKA